MERENEMSFGRIRKVRERATYSEHLMIPLESETQLALSRVGVTLLLEKPQALHLDEIIQGTRRLFLFGDGFKSVARATAETSEV